ncbi:MAG: hypothetical protein LUI39_12310 [Lachnospiraceae bacterium]|nr:hypothetical protein [Lachnospiraceae bacterium]
MPFTIVRQDITKMNVDAVVNAANTDLRMGGGVCGAIFLGANMDAVTTARSFGISENRAADYVADSEGTELNFRMMSETVADYRVSGAVPEACLESIRKDARKRKAASEKS